MKWLHLAWALVAAAPTAEAAAATRIAVVLDEQVLDEPQRESELEAALVEVLSGRAGVVFVDPTRAEGVRAAAQGAPLASVDTATLVGSLDADLLIVGEADFSSADAGYLKGVSAVEASARLRVVAVDSAEVLGALRAQAMGSHYGQRFAVARAAEALAKRLAEKLTPLLDRAHRFELLVELPAPIDARAAESVTTCIEREPDVRSVQTLHLGKDRLKLEVQSDVSTRALAVSLSRHDGRCGVSVEAYSARELRGRYRPEREGRVPLRAIRFAHQGRRRAGDRWLKTELPRAVLAELASIPSLDVDPSMPLGGPAQKTRALVLRGSFSRVAEGVRVEVGITPAGSRRRPLLSQQILCPKGEIASCALELGRRLAKAVPAMLRNHRSVLGLSEVPNIARGAPIRIEVIEAEPVFPARWSRYRGQASVGRVRVQNMSARPLERLTVMARLGELSERVWRSKPEHLAAGEARTLSVGLWLSEDELRQHEGNRTVAMDLDIEFEVDGYQYLERRSAATMVLDKHAVRWDRSAAAVAAFVTFRAPFVMEMARTARAAVPVDIRHPLREVLALFAGLRGLRYVRDAVNPFDPRGLDYVRFPAETWREGEGDCDDLAILYAALLEASGYPSMLLQAPGHVFVAVGVGVSPTAAETLSLDPDASFPYDEQLWLPIETTAAGEGFAAAWAKGAEAMRGLRRSGQSAKRIVIREGWRVYPPTDLSSANVSDLEPRAASSERLRAEIVSLESERAQALQKRIRELRAKGDAQGLNGAGVLLALERRLPEARTSLEASVRMLRTGAAENNLGNLALLDGQTREALERYDAARRLEKGQVHIVLNAVLASYLLTLKDPRTQVELTSYIDEALRLDTSAVEAFLRRLPGSSDAPAHEQPMVSLSGLRGLLSEALGATDKEAGVVASGPNTLRLEDFIYWMH